MCITELQLDCVPIMISPGAQQLSQSNYPGHTSRIEGALGVSEALLKMLFSHPPSQWSHLLKADDA